MGKKIVGVDFVVAALGVAVLLHSSVASAQSTSVPLNVGLVPYVDVNAHFRAPHNHLSIDAIAGLTSGLDGVALAGVAGTVLGDVRGAQLAGVLSVARGTVNGLQASGVVSYAGQLSGAQLGLVNVAGKVRGLQLGLINVAEEVDGAVLGLVNVVRKNGRHELDVWTSNTAAFSLGTKLGTRHIYSILAFGVQRAKAQTAWMPTVGLGGSIPILGRGFVNIDLLASMVNLGAEVDLASLLGQLRVAGGIRVTDKLAIYAGPVLDVFRGSSTKRLADFSYTSSLATLDAGRTPVDLGLGFVVGLQAL